MARLLVLYNQPTDAAAFDSYYSQSHLPLARQIPGLRSLITSANPPTALAGAAPYLIAELNFDSMTDLQAGLASPQGQAAAGDLANFAHSGATLLAYETCAQHE